MQYFKDVSQHYEIWYALDVESEYFCQVLHHFTEGKKEIMQVYQNDAKHWINEILNQQLQPIKRIVFEQAIKLAAASLQQTFNDFANI